MMIKVIATDMDGTLLDARGQLDLPRLEKILDQLDQRGIRFVIATGNEIHRMRQLLSPWWIEWFWLLLMALVFLKTMN